jgi:hypothetical protein
MGRQAAVALYVLALVAVVVSVDVLFFRNRFWARLMVNVGIVLVFAAFTSTAPSTEDALRKPICRCAQKLLGHWRGCACGVRRRRCGPGLHHLS